MKTIATVRYISGREERFEIDILGGNTAEDRLKTFTKDPSILLQTENEVIIIPATAIECVTLNVPEEAAERFALPSVRKAKRIEEVE